MFNYISSRKYNGLNPINITNTMKGVKMMNNLITFSGLEDIIRTAIKLSSISTREIAKKIMMSNSGMYCFTRGQNHISISKGDKIIEFLKLNDPMALQSALNLYFNN